MKLAFVTLFVFLYQITFSQLSVEFSSGYAVPLVNPFNNHTTFSGLSFTWYEDYGYNYGEYYQRDDNGYYYSSGLLGYYVLNSGLNFNLSLSYQSKSWFRISAGIFYLNNKHCNYQKKTDSYILTNNFYHFHTRITYYDSVEYQNTDLIQVKSYLRQITPLIKFEFIKSFKKLDVSFFISQGVSFLLLTKENQWTFSSIDLRQYDYYLEKYHKNFQYTCQLGLNLSYRISNSISIFSSATFFDGTFTPDRGEIILQKGNSTQKDGTYYSYENNEVRKINFNSVTQNGDYRKEMTYEGSAINYSIGLRYSFGKKEKAAEEK